MISVTMSADCRPLLAVISEANRFVDRSGKIRDGILCLPNLANELACFQFDIHVADRTRQVFVRLNPSDRFRDFLAAVRAWNLDGLIIEKSTGHGA